MNEFLTENARRAYPLERAIQDGARPLWAQLLLDACVATDAELPNGERLSLLAVARATGRLLLMVGSPSTGEIAVPVPRGQPDFAVVYAAQATSKARLKAFLTVDGRVADRIMDATGYGTARTAVGVPFALRCTSSGHRRVTSVSAYSAGQCETPVFAGHASETPVRTVSGDVVVTAGEGVDAEAVGMLPLEGRLLRLSAIAAPEETSADDTVVDLMVRGDECISVEAMPGTKVEGDAVVPRTADDPDGRGVTGGGVLRITNSCKACCQCGDYKAALDAVRDPEELAIVVKQMLDEAKAAYDAAVVELEGLKAAATDRVNDLGNVRCGAVAATSQAMYADSGASGTRARVAITLSVENMTQLDVTVELPADAFNLNDAGAAPANRFSHVRTAWTRVSGGETGSGTWTPGGQPLTAVLKPGGTLLVSATYARTATANAAAKPAGMTVSVRLSSASGTKNRTVSVT